MDEAKLVPIDDENETQEVEVLNNVSTIDFMLPDDERNILQYNLNNYGDTEKMQKTLKEAQKNAKIRQSVKDLQMMEKYSEIIDLTQKKQSEMLQIILQPEYFEALAKEDPEGAFKALRSLGEFNKTNVQAREDLFKKVNGKSSKKKFKIDLKFSNDSGEEYEFGVET